ncbi:Uncharacterised protein [Providencia rettgeri]|nr:hypothetical protein [Providencia rettgeri]CAB5577051.1 Uncharacterised protein [Providencia rettgeri]CAC9130230.1 Uncharacterised protein [Providencia rettgeri]
MKLSYIDSLGFILIILIAFMFIGDNFTRTQDKTLVNFKYTEIVRCQEARRCILDNEVSKEKNNKFDLMKNIKEFLRKKIIK